MHKFIKREQKVAMNFLIKSYNWGTRRECFRADKKKKKPAFTSRVVTFTANQKDLKMLLQCPSHLTLPGEKFFHTYKISIWQDVLLLRKAKKIMLERKLSEMNGPIPCLFKHHLNSSRWLGCTCYAHEWLCSDTVIPSYPTKCGELFALTPNGSKYFTSEIAWPPSPSTIK